jgi:chloramphenicol-sensitive protein RarD
MGGDDGGADLVNWGIYVWAIGSGHALDAALGYYINPLFSIFLGAVLLGERMGGMQMAGDCACAWIAVGDPDLGGRAAAGGGAGADADLGVLRLSETRLPIGPNQGFTLEVLHPAAAGAGLCGLAGPVAGIAFHPAGRGWDDVLLVVMRDGDGGAADDLCQRREAADGCRPSRSCNTSRRR